MGETLNAPTRRRTRRSHAERKAETSARIKQAVVESIAELGFHRTTAAEISKRSGVSWGAAQHHFGDKDGIFAAVLVDSFNLLVDELEGLPREGAPLRERVDAFVEAAWAHLGGPHYRCTFEILLNMPAPDWGSAGDPLRAETLRIWNGIWTRFFPESDLDERTRTTLQYYAISTLTGLAAMEKFESPTAEQRKSQLGFLKDTLTRELKRGSGEG
ncbi:MAG: TetR/AcrR family transcriptional regulator [Myxococcota bacterium]|nr:TetR/AcrR family transcriptional regulator [Myxococcota bacterium]